MANKTVKDAITVHGTNPQYLIEKIIRTRIYECRYWKEECFGLSAELVVDKGTELRYIGGSYGGNIKTTPFLCLTLKLLQIQPEKDIIIEFIRQENFKYVRALGAFYLRLIGNSLDIYKYLEPLYNDYRKLRRMTKMGTFDIVYMDEFIDLLLREDRVFDIILPRLTKRFVHEENGELTKRISLIEEDLDLDANNDDDDDDKNDSDKNASLDSDDDDRNRKKRRSRTPERYRSHHDDDDDRRRRRNHQSSPSTSSHRRYNHDNDDDRQSHGHHHSRRQRSSSRDRRHNRRSRTPDEKSSNRQRDHRKDKRKDYEQPEKSKEPKNETDEIAEMNALRAKLGLKPLRP
uniref:Pre-mRNA-splicing factor 38 n=1 Tax=Dermatophagoides pteronyssinus TaxID=6956 RepID=A0A6P6YEJ0_DERPT|nr:pre-mRNA-splicing factor 38A-like [Dermatophagoides pteronyssinus]